MYTTHARKADNKVTLSFDPSVSRIPVSVLKWMERRSKKHNSSQPSRRTIKQRMTNEYN